MHFIGILGYMSHVIAQVQQNTSVLSYLQEKFVAGGLFMWPILASLVLGLAFSFEWLWTLSRSRVNTKNFLVEVKNALKTGGVQQ